MRESRLTTTLRSLVQKHGIGPVLTSLGEIETASAQTKDHTARGNRSVRKHTAQSYVARMHLPGDRQRTLSLIAERFDQKSFLPTFREIVVFCESRGIDVPRSTARASAIPRIFKFMAREIGNSELERIWEDTKFSGPTQLGPIADAIERNGRARRYANHAPSTHRATEEHIPRWRTDTSNSEVH